MARKRSTIKVPVRVAQSISRSGVSEEASTSASASTSRPSASGWETDIAANQKHDQRQETSWTATKRYKGQQQHHQTYCDGHNSGGNIGKKQAKETFGQLPQADRWKTRNGASGGVPLNVAGGLPRVVVATFANASAIRKLRSPPSTPPNTQRNTTQPAPPSPSLPSPTLRYVTLRYATLHNHDITLQNTTQHSAQPPVVSEHIRPQPQMSCAMDVRDTSTTPSPTPSPTVDPPVLPISLVLPDRATSTSPGRKALPSQPKRVRRNSNGSSSDNSKETV